MILTGFSMTMCLMAVAVVVYRKDVKIMTLKEFIEQYPNEGEFTVFDNEYGVETYFYHPDVLEPWDVAMNKIAGLLNVIEYKEPTATRNPITVVDLSELIKRNISNGKFAELFKHNDIDSIMDDIEAIFAGNVSEIWLTEFANSLE